VSGRSSQSVQVITRTRNHDVKSCGMPLPVLVTEALTYADSKHVLFVYFILPMFMSSHLFIYLDLFVFTI